MKAYLIALLLSIAIPMTHAATIEGITPQATYMVNGFQGSQLKNGEKAGFRIQNGWQNTKLPWNTKPNPDKIYRTNRTLN